MVMLLSNYNHEPLSGESYDESQALNQPPGDMLTPTQAPAGGAAVTSTPSPNCSMQELKPGSDQQGAVCNPARALRIKPQPNQVLKCPRCNSLNTKFCYYNNYSLSQPRHFCKNCRRYWTKGGALRNVPVGGGCRKNKRAKQKNSDHSSTANASNGDKSCAPFSSGDPLAGRHGPLLGAGCSTSSLFDLGKEEDGGIGLPYSRLAHTMRLSEHSGTSSGLSFEIPRGSQPLSFSSLPLSLPAFDTGLPAGTLNFQGLMKQEHGGGAPGSGMNSGDFSSMYDPSLNLLGPASSAAAAAQAVAPLTEGLSTFNLGLENFVGLGLNGDMKWRQQQHQQQAPKITSLLDPEHHHHGHHHHHHHHHPGLLHQLEDTEGLVAAGRSSSNKTKSMLLDEAAAATHGSSASEWQQQQQQQQHQQQQQQQSGGPQQQQQETGFVESSGGDTTYWNGTGWPLVDLPIYVDQQQQYCDVKSVEPVDYYSSRAATTMSRCTPSLT